MHLFVVLVLALSVLPADGISSKETTAPKVDYVARLNQLVGGELKCPVRMA